MIVPARLPNLPEFLAMGTPAVRQRIGRTATIECFIDLVNHLEEVPDEGFHWLPGSARLLNGTETLVHFTDSRAVAASILAEGFRGRAAWHSSDTSHRDSEEGFYAFAYDASLRDMDSAAHSGPDVYGGWGLLFTSAHSAKVYNLADAEPQVVFGAASARPRLVFRQYRDESGTNPDRLLYDVLDLALRPLVSAVRFEQVKRLFLNRVHLTG